jgi:palmitoyl-protein thioesterase
MESITKAAGTHAGVYSVCVPGGINQIEDTLSAFLINMNKNVDYFAEQVRNNTKLAGGFDAFGLSQGNAIIRGYIQRYNNPQVRNYLAIHGVDFGVMGFPNCNPAGIEKSFCDTLVEFLGDLAYDPISQEVLFQTNYFRDPEKLTTRDYLTNSQIAQWNNENPGTVNATLKTNFGLVKSWNMIKAMKDTMVFPNEGEWWGQFVPGQFQTIQTMNQTALYAGDNFGLKTADSLHKIRFNFTLGEHLEFTVQQLEYWIDEYFL